MSEMRMTLSGCFHSDCGPKASDELPEGVTKDLSLVAQGAVPRSGAIPLHSLDPNNPNTPS